MLTLLLFVQPAGTLRAVSHEEVGKRSNTDGDNALYIGDRGNQ